MNAYQQRVNAENLKRQAPEVRKTVAEILKEIKSIEQSVYWALNPDERDGGIQWSESLIEHAHSLVDIGHEYRAALKANPPPKEEPEGLTNMEEEEDVAPREAENGNGENDAA